MIENIMKSNEPKTCLRDGVQITTDSSINQFTNLCLCDVCAVLNTWTSSRVKTCHTNLVLIQLLSYRSPLKSLGDPPGYNRCLVSMVSKSELVSSSVKLEQLVSSCWHKEQLLSEFLRIFTDVLGFFAAFSIIDEYCREQLMG